MFHRTVFGRNFKHMNILVFNTIANNITSAIKQKCDLNLSQTRILLYFDQHHNHELTIGKLATELGIALSTLSRQLHQNQTETLIAIGHSDRDSSKLISLNKQGLQKVNELKQALVEIENSLFSKLSNPETAMLDEVLTKLL